jgi:integrase
VALLRIVEMVALHEQNLEIKIYLTQIYTNHSIRAMGATILGRNCSMAQIMAVTGHKSASSVAVYQRVSSKEKQVMGDIITSSVRGEQPSQLSSIMPPIEWLV